jgi:transposase
MSRGKPELGWPSSPPADLSSPFTPKHGSWLNLVEGFFSKLARSILRHIRVASKQELLAFLHLASIRLMLKKLCNPA